MFAISVISKSGGSKTILGKTLQECRDNSAACSDKTKHNYLASTIPYAIWKVKGTLNIYDVSVPFEIKQAIGQELRLALTDEQE